MIKKPIHDNIIGEYEFMTNRQVLKLEVMPVRWVAIRALPSSWVFLLTKKKSCGK